MMVADIKRMKQDPSKYSKAERIRLVQEVRMALEVARSGKRRRVVYIEQTSDSASCGPIQFPVSRVDDKNNLDKALDRAFTVRAMSLLSACPCSAHAMLPMQCPCNAHAVPMQCPCNARAPLMPLQHTDAFVILRTGANAHHAVGDG